MTKFNMFSVIVRYDKQQCEYKNEMNCEICKHYDDWHGCNNYITVTEALSATEVTFIEDARPSEVALKVKTNDGKRIYVLMGDLLEFELNGKVHYKYKEHIEETEQKEISIFKKIQELIPMPPSIDILHINQFLEEGMEDQLLCEAVDIAKEKQDIKDPMDRWKYFKGIIRYWYNNGIKTYEELKKCDK